MHDARPHPRDTPPAPDPAAGRACSAGWSKHGGHAAARSFHSTEACCVLKGPPAALVPAPPAAPLRPAFKSTSKHQEAGLRRARLHCFIPPPCCSLSRPQEQPSDAGCPSRPRQSRRKRPRMARRRWGGELHRQRRLSWRPFTAELTHARRVPCITLEPMCEGAGTTGLAQGPLRCGALAGSAALQIVVGCHFGDTRRSASV